LADIPRLNDKDKMEQMGIKPKDAMDLAISTISAMTFSWG
jgi:aarF domain-containing kinase